MCVFELVNMIVMMWMMMMSAGPFQTCEPHGKTCLKHCSAEYEQDLKNFFDFVDLKVMTLVMMIVTSAGIFQVDKHLVITCLSCYLIL